jgi:hypothetical protein
LVRQAQQRAKIADEMRTAFKVSLFLVCFLFFGVGKLLAKCAWRSAHCVQSLSSFFFEYFFKKIVKKIKILYELM